MIKNVNLNKLPSGGLSNSTGSLYSTITAILSKYDVSNISKADTEKIISDMVAAGIKPSKVMERILQMNGFGSEGIGDLVKIEELIGKNDTKNGNTFSQSSIINNSEYMTTYNLLKGLISNDNKSSLSQEEIKAYTIKTLLLKDDAKSQVYGILNKYSYDDTANRLSEEEIKKIVTSKLNYIFSQVDNFKEVGFYI